MNRRTFLKWLGVGAVTFAANPKELLEGLDKPELTPISSVMDGKMTAQEVGDDYLRGYADNMKYQFAKVPSAKT